MGGFLTSFPTRTWPRSRVNCSHRKYLGSTNPGLQTRCACIVFARYPTVSLVGLMGYIMLLLEQGILDVLSLSGIKHHGRKKNREEMQCSLGTYTSVVKQTILLCDRYGRSRGLLSSDDDVQTLTNRDQRRRPVAPESRRKSNVDHNPMPSSSTVRRRERCGCLVHHQLQGHSPDVSRKCAGIS
jgi:hypothetical protein